MTPTSALKHSRRTDVKRATLWAAGIPTGAALLAALGQPGVATLTVKAMAYLFSAAVVACFLWANLIGLTAAFGKRSRRVDASLMLIVSWTLLAAFAAMLTWAPAQAEVDAENAERAMLGTHPWEPGQQEKEERWLAAVEAAEDVNRSRFLTAGALLMAGGVAGLRLGLLEFVLRSRVAPAST